MDRNRRENKIVPFALPWHVIQEVDLVRLIGDHHRRAALCVHAEVMADDLPRRPDAKTLTAFLAALDERVIQTETDDWSFWGAMQVHGRDDTLVSTVLDHIRARRASDVASAREVIAALDAGADIAPDMLGYILRGFFTHCLRSIDFEQLAVLAMAGHRMTPDARALLTDALAEGVAA